MKKPSPKSVGEIDRLVAMRLRFRRREINLIQSDLAARVNITHQQVQKYESFINRISAGRLYEFSVALGVTVDYFYQEADAEDENVFTLIPKANKDGAALATAIEFERILDPGIRKQFLLLIKAIGKADKGSSSP